MRADPFWHLFRLEFVHHLRRPMFWVLAFLLGITAFGIARGGVTIQAGDSSVGGEKAWLTSEFSNAFIQTINTLIYFGFFVAVAAGLSIPRDEELKIGEIVHATPITTREYVWAKFAAVCCAFFLLLIGQVALNILFFHAMPNPSADKIIGPLVLANYFRPAFLIGVPMLLFIAGVTFATGEFTRRPAVVFLFPIALLVVCVFFVWEWSPTWLDPRVNALLGWIDPAGYRWLNETHLKVDRGVAYYNTQPVIYDAPFLMSRVAFGMLGLGAVLFAERHFRRRSRGVIAQRTARAGSGDTVVRRIPTSTGVGTIGMTTRPLPWLTEVVHVARFEFRGLIGSPGMFLFIPLILLQTVPDAYARPGMLGTFSLVTAGTYAGGSMSVLVVCIGLLLLFYTAESIDRERATGIWPIIHATPMRAAAWLTGKSLANTFVAFSVLCGAFAGFLILLAIQGSGRIELLPFALIWIGLMGPTFFVWTAWVILLLVATHSKYLTYALALATMIGTGWLGTVGEMNWVYNWNLLGAGRWSDLGTLEPNFRATLLNRGLWISVGALFIALTVHIFERREFDATRIVHRLSPRQIWRSSRWLLVAAALPAVVASYIGFAVAKGPEGKRRQNIERDYWRQNISTWKDAPRPALRHVEADLRLDPVGHAFDLKGNYELANIEDNPMRQVALTLGHHIQNAKWTMNGVQVTPENRTNLFVFTPPQPLAIDDKVTIGFEYSATLPDGMSRNVGGASEFIQPSGVVIQGWSPTVFPTVGWLDGMGIEAGENDYEPRVYPDDHFECTVKAAYGSPLPFTTRIRVNVPEEYRGNSNGELVEEIVADGRRISTWQTEHPIMMFNVIAGKWEVTRGEGVAIFHHPDHSRNVPEMLRALEGARKYYSEWFYPYLWKELKLSEFAALANYAQGFATNITFSESIGFLTRSSAKSRAAFSIAAHEAAHQWWGNTLVPGEGPGGNILSEGMAHFSTILLTEQILGEQARIEFCKRIEESYNESRVIDSERPMVKVQGDKDGDTTVMYDKGGMVFYMLHRLMGREANLAGLQAFIRNHEQNPDHPLLEDFVNEMRPFAPDHAAYDEFTRQWFFETSIPSYKIGETRVERGESGWIVSGTITNTGSGVMPIQVAAASQESRFEEQSEEKAEQGPASVAPGYRDARTALRLAAGESASFRIDCDFEPKLVLVDPDATILMINRKHAIMRF